MSGRTAPTRRPRAEPCRVCAEHCAAACWVRCCLRWPSAASAEQAAAGPRAAPRAPPERAERHRHGRGADLPLRAVTRSSPNPPRPFRRSAISKNVEEKRTEKPIETKEKITHMRHTSIKSSTPHLVHRRTAADSSRCQGSFSTIPRVRPSVIYYTAFGSSKFMDHAAPELNTRS